MLKNVIAAAVPLGGTIGRATRDQWRRGSQTSGHADTNTVPDTDTHAQTQTQTWIGTDTY